MVKKSEEHQAELENSIRQIGNNPNRAKEVQKLQTEHERVTELLRKAQVHRQSGIQVKVINPPTIHR
jgi:hypothetical protein